MGDNNAVIVQILAAVAVLFLCFVTYKNTKTWRWLHVTALFLVFAAAMTFAVYAAAVSKMRQAWQKTIADLEKRVTAEEQKLEVAVHGNGQANPPESGFLEVREQIARTVIDRGRVWRNCTLLETQVTSPGAPVSEVRAKLSTVPKTAIEGQKVKPNGMREKTILYAFKRISDDNQPLRYIYLGEFYAAAVADDSVSLNSTLPLSAVEQGLLEGNQEWVLHEGMPRDSHDALTLGNNELDFNTILHADEFPTPESYAATVAEYARHNKQATDDDTQRTENLEKIYARVKFKQAHKFTVDAADMQSPASDGSESRLFNINGEALAPLLRRGQDVEFKTGDEAVLIYYGARDDAGNVRENGAKELEDQGIVEVVEKIYRRKFNDYSHQFREIWLQRVKIQQMSRALDYEIDQVDKEFALSEANLKVLEDRISKLTDDEQKLVNEKTKITEYVASVKSSLDRARGEFAKLVREIDTKHAALVAASKRALASVPERESASAPASR